jgi:hypothetical protein
MTGFQTFVNTDLPVAVEGDFASANPRASMLSIGSQLVAGSAGVVVGRFGRALLADGSITNAKPAGASRLGFIHRDQPALITGWLQQASMVVQAGLEMTMFDMGDFWARFAGGAAVGQKVFASNLDGAAEAGTAGSPPAVNSFTAAAGAAFTGSIATNVLTVTAVADGALSVGDLITGAGIIGDVFISSLGTGTGGTGTYNLSATPGTIASEAMVASSTVMIVSAVGSGTLVAGQELSGTGVTAGTAIAAQLTGSAGAAGRYSISPRSRFASTTVAGSDASESIFYVHSACAPGELAMISDRPVTL